MCRKNTFLFHLACLVVMTMATTLLADTKSVSMGFSDPGNAADATVTVQFQNTATNPYTYRYVYVTIPANSNAQQKRDAITAKLRENGFTVNNTGDNGLTMPRIDSKVNVYFYNGGTMESDVMTCAAPVDGRVEFAGDFDPFTPDGQPAVFTAGIVTDVGELSATISAEELNFRTNGPVICQALLERLAPRAPEYGVQIIQASDQLEVQFDPAFVVNQGGIIWGTTSPSEGCGGALALGYPEMDLSISGLVAGGRATLSAEGAQAFESVYFYYGRSIGETYLPNLDVTLSLDSPVLIGSARANQDGQAVISRNVPMRARRLTLHFQAAAVGEISQTITQRVR